MFYFGPSIFSFALTPPRGREQQTKGSFLRPYPLLLALLLLGGCATPSEVLLPIPASVVNASFVRDVEMVVRPSARESIQAADAKAAGKAVAAPGDPASLPFEQMMRRAVEEETRSAGLRSGRALRLVIEVDRLHTASTGAALLGTKGDRLAGSVFVQDAGDRTPLGQLYVDVNRRQSGPVGLLLRGSGVREQLAREFAQHIARALSDGSKSR